MQQLNDIFLTLHQYIAGNNWFIFLLLGTGVFFTFYLKFPQIRYFSHAIRIVKGKYDKETDKGDTSHFQALATALSGTVGTGNIAGVALAVHLGGPAALFWMLMTALLGMCTKFVEVTLSHKYRDFDEKGMVAGGPMYYMKKRLNITLKNGKQIKTGYWIGGFFAVASILSSFGTGSLPQVNSISNAMFATFGIQHVVTGAILSVLLALIIIGGIKRIAQVTEKLVPFMAILYFAGAIAVIFSNYQNIIPSFIALFRDVFTGTAAVGGFLGAGFAFAFNNGVNRGLFSNEAGQGSAPIAHAAAKAHEPVSEGMVAIALLLFAFSTAIAWSYYGDRSVTYLVGAKYVVFYRIIFVLSFFLASFTDTTIIWNLSLITIAFMTVPNLIGLLILHKEVKSTIKDYWVDFKKEHP